MKVLHTDRLTLRPWAESDIDFAFDMYSRWDVKRYVGVVPRVMEDRAEAVELIARLGAFDHPVHGHWVVASAVTGEQFGTILLKSIPASGDTEPLQPSGDTEIGWHFHPDAWGHGYASEAAVAVLAHAFDGGLERVVAVTHPENVASQAVCTRIGMLHHGQTTAYYNATCELFIGVPT